MKKSQGKSILSILLAVSVTFSTMMVGGMIPSANAQEPPAAISAIEPLNIQTPLNIAPKMPAEVAVTYQGGTSGKQAVTWDAISPDSLKTTHRFQVNGKLTNGGQAVSARIEVVASVVLDDFENGTVDANGVASGKIAWSGGTWNTIDTKVPPTEGNPPALSFVTDVVHSGKSALKMVYDNTVATGTGSAYMIPNKGQGIVFQPGEVPQKIKFWVYGNNMPVYSLRAWFDQGTTPAPLNSQSGHVLQNLGADALQFNGWRQLEYTVDPAFQTTGLCISMLPGVIEVSGTKKAATLYFDDFTAVYGAETKDLTEINTAITSAQSVYDATKDDSGCAQSEKDGLKAAIDAAVAVRENAAAGLQDIYTATDILNYAVESYQASQSEKALIDDYEDKGGSKSMVDWIFDSKGKGEVGYNTDKNYVKNGDRSLMINYQFAGTAGTASASVKGDHYPNSALKFAAGGKVPQKFGIWVYGAGQSVLRMQLEVRKADGTGYKQIDLLNGKGVIANGWNYYTADLEANGFTSATGALFNQVPGIVVISDAGRINSTLYMDDAQVIYASSATQKTALIGAVASAKAAVIGAVEGTLGGQYPVGSVTDLNNLVAASQNKLANGSQTEINEAITALNNAVKAFLASKIPDIDKPGLKQKIDAAQTVYDTAATGPKPGEYSEAAKQNLKTAIEAAQAVYIDAGANAAAVEQAKTDIAAAVGNFKTQVNPALDFAKLDEAITTAEKLATEAVAGTAAGQYPQAAIDAMKSAVQTAKADKTAAEKQKDIFDAVDKLSSARSLFDKAMVPYSTDKSALKTALEAAKALQDSTMTGTLGGQYPENSYQSLSLAMEHALAVYNNIRAQQSEISAEVTVLNLAVEQYQAARIAAPWDKYNIPDEMPANKREMRAAWVSTVVNIDWPKASTWSIQDKEERIAKQKADLIAILDDLQKLGSNAVFFQVRPTSDALYKSELAPWSYYLTGEYGKDPGFDPLQFAIEETHKRSMELHAWCNPYRVSMPPALYNNADGSKLSNLDQVGALLEKDSKSVYAKHKDWVRVASSRFVLDPGIPEAQDYVEDCIMEIVKNYDVDGIHFDDYFYVGSKGGFDTEGADQATYEKYGKAQFSNIDDWRRNNTYTLIKNLHEKINAAKPWIKFGVSPAGVWRNQKDDPLGSPTNAGIPNYDSARADTRKWALEEIIDYICPQVYWTFNNKAAGYGVVTSWWANLLKDNPQVNTQLYIGMGLYRLNQDDEGLSNDPYFDTAGVGDQEIIRQLKYNAVNPDIDGSSLFTYNSTIASYPNALSAAKMIREKAWANKALVPGMPWKNTPAASAVVLDSAIVEKNGVALSWNCNDDNAKNFAVYRFDAGETVDISQPKKLIAKVYKSANGVQNFVDASGTAGCKYVVTALNRTSDESVPSNEETSVYPKPDFVSFTPVADVTIQVGGQYSLPQTVTANYSDGSAKELKVVWDTSKVDVSKVGTYAVLGTIDGISQQPSVNIIVTEKSAPELVGFVPIQDVTVQVGGEYALPQTVTANYSDGSAKELKVAWDTSKVDVSKAGTYTVLGTIDGISQQPSVNIIVTEKSLPELIGFASINDITVKVDGEYTLPETITANYSDGSTRQLKVVWDTSNVDVSKIGTYTVTGAVEGTDKKVTVTITVQAKDDNASNQPTPSTGDSLPAAAVILTLALGGVLILLSRKLRIVK